jgi:hypothetical protein
MQISIIDGIDVAVEDFSLFQVFTIKHGVARFLQTTEEMIPTHGFGEFDEIVQSWSE